MFRFFALAWFCAVLSAPGGAEAALQPRPLPAAQVPASLTALMRKSALVFEGTVMAVSRLPPDSGNRVASTKITFRIDRGIAGVRTGQTLTVKEWAGLWETGERYHPGERMLLFLHRPSRLGFTSAVGGTLGRFKIDRDGFVLLPPVQASVAAPATNGSLRTIPTNRISGAQLLRALKVPRE